MAAKQQGGHAETYLRKSQHPPSPEQGIGQMGPWEDVEEEGRGGLGLLLHPVHTSFTEQPDLSFGKATAAY